MTRSHLLKVALLVLLSMLVGVLAGAYSLAVFFVLLCTLAFLVGAHSVKRSKRQVDILNPLVVFPMLFILYFAIGSSNQGLYLGVNVTNLSWATYALAIGAFFMGALIMKRTNLESFDSAQSEEPLAHLENRAIKTLWRTRNAVFFVGMLAVGYSAIMSGVPMLSTQVDASRFLYSSPLGRLWPFALRLLTVAGIFSIAIHFLNPFGSRAQRFANLALGLLAVLALALFGSRVFLFPVFIALIVFRHYFKRRLAVRVAAALLSLLVIALSLFGLHRITSGGELDNATRHFEAVGMPASFLALGPAYLSVLNGPHVLATTLERVPRIESFQYGRMILGEIVTLAPGYQPLPDQWVAEHIMQTRTIQSTGGKIYQGQSGGIPPTLLGGLYIDFGFAGIAVGMALIGALLYRLHRSANMSSDPFHVALYALVLAYFALSIYGFATIKFSEIWQTMLVLLPLRSMNLRRTAGNPSVTSDVVPELQRVGWADE